MADSKCYVLVRGRNAQPFVERCIDSILSQTYRNLTILFVDDASEYTREVKKSIRERLGMHVCVWRTERYYSVRNAYEMIHQYCQDPQGIVINLDADDWFSTPESVSIIAKNYQEKKCLFAYGDCYLWSGRDENELPIASKVMAPCNIPYLPEVIKNNTYRDVQFMPLHPRTWKVHAFKKIDVSSFQRSDGSWLQFCEDQAIYYPIFEMFGQHGAVFSEPLIVYNQANQLADIKVNRIATLKDELEIRRKPRYESINL
jgi:glycosyltransferase involved in cell wall biosynthesis